jgi:hypothetical protein
VAGSNANCANPATTTCNFAGNACLLNSGQPCTSNAQCVSNNCNMGTGMCL